MKRLQKFNQGRLHLEKMKNKIIILLLFGLFIITGCWGTCPSGYSYYDNKCYKYENIDSEIEYYCNSGGTLYGTKSIVTEEYNCSIVSSEEICTKTYDYPATKEYVCPDNYELNGIKCSKIVYYK